MTRTIYFDCFSGCSGDMLVGAMLDSGLELETLKKGLTALNFSGYNLSSEKTMRSSIAATKFNVILDEQTARPRRGLRDILDLIGSSTLPEGVKEKSVNIFRKLGQVEAEVHGIPLDQVHFHEIGAIDSIVDIVGAIFALDSLGIEHYFCSALPLGSGYVSTDHGILPVPAPATLKLLAQAGAPIAEGPESTVARGELVTPTGAALVTSLSIFRRPDMKVEKVGYGAGSKDFKEWPNVLRVWIGEDVSANNEGDLTLLETNIDDMNPQIYGFLMEKLLSEGAADVWFTPIQMKKNRPAIMLSALSPAGYEDRLTKIIMRETSTLGIRSRRVTRHIANRQVITIESSLGQAHAKIKQFGEILSISPEYEDCRRIALERDLPLNEVLRIIEIEARTYLDRIH